jgi:hypothetical protein
MTRYWFRPKRYGYGATPVTWEGWVFTMLVAVVLAGSVSLLIQYGRAADPAMILVWAAVVAIVIAVLVAVTKAKTEGGWRWRWGDDR